MFSSSSDSSYIRVKPRSKLSHREKQAAPKTRTITTMSYGAVTATGIKKSRLIKSQKRIRHFKVSVHHVFSNTDIGFYTSIDYTIQYSMKATDNRTTCTQTPKVMVITASLSNLKGVDRLSSIAASATPSTIEDESDRSGKDSDYA